MGYQRRPESLKSMKAQRVEESEGVPRLGLRLVTAVTSKSRDYFD